MRTIVITGASDGIGRAAALRIAAMENTQVVVVGRSPEKTREVARRIDAPWCIADFARLNDVRALAQTLLERYPTIDVLVNNAGGSFRAGKHTADGYDQTIQIDVLAPFLLTRLLITRLLASHASMITTSSVAAYWGRITSKTLKTEDFGSAAQAYGTAKLMDLMLSMEFQQRYGPLGLACAAFHPGVVATHFGSNGSSFFRWLYQLRLAKSVMSTPERGADELVRLATGRPGVDWVPGGFTKPGGTLRIPVQARDPTRRRMLWSWASDSVGIDIQHFS